MRGECNAFNAWHKNDPWKDWQLVENNVKSMHRATQKKFHYLSMFYGARRLTGPFGRLTTQEHHTLDEFIENDVVGIAQPITAGRLLPSHAWNENT